MRFVCYDDLDSGSVAQLGIEVFGTVYDLAAVVARVPSLLGLPTPPAFQTVWEYCALAPTDKARLAVVVDHLHDLTPAQRGDLLRTHTRRLSPVPSPRSLRCFAAFEAHACAARTRRGMTLPDEWYDAPAFFFGNHNSIYGPGDEVPQPASFWLDYELQIACVIGKAGINIQAADAEAHIAGYTILNDWCARDLEMNELRMGIGPSKGRDFAVSMGPALVTPDELESYGIGEGAQRRYDLAMAVSVNDHLLNVVPGSFREIHFTCAQMIERASANTMLYPGDVLGSGAVGGGSLLSLGAEETLGRWLQPGDRIDLEVEGLGVLRNTIVPPPYA